MNKAGQISDNEKWQAVVSCKESYDGLFLYGVKTTGIFCRPSCRAKTPVRENVVFFDNATNAVNEGFRPCKKCCPDKAVFEPDLELVKKAKDIIDDNYTDSIEADDIGKWIGVSSNHLTRLFKKQYGITPTRYIKGLRVKKAVELLEKTDAKVSEVAYSTGFKSLSGFYKHFKEQIGYAPTKLRERGGEL